MCTSLVRFGLIACLVFVGCKSKGSDAALAKWSQKVGKHAYDAIDDPVRAGNAGRIAEEMSAHLVLFYGEIELVQAKVARLNADYNAPRSRFDAIYDDGVRKQTERIEALVRLSMEMRKQMSREEWTKFAARAKTPHTK